jgi:hypothetical protein
VWTRGEGRDKMEQQVPIRAVPSQPYIHAQTPFRNLAI